MTERIEEIREIIGLVFAALMVALLLAFVIWTMIGNPMLIEERFDLLFGILIGAIGTALTVFGLSRREK